MSARATCCWMSMERSHKQPAARFKLGGWHCSSPAIPLSTRPTTLIGSPLTHKVLSCSGLLLPLPGRQGDRRHLRGGQGGLPGPHRRQGPVLLRRPEGGEAPAPALHPGDGQGGPRAGEDEPDHQFPTERTAGDGRAMGACVRSERGLTPPSPLPRQRPGSRSQSAISGQYGRHRS